MHDKANTVAAANGDRSPRRPYAAPELHRESLLSQVTALKEISGDKKKKEVICWVARAVYGEDNPRWLLFRGWLLQDAPGWFRRLYVRHGESFARRIEHRSLVKRAIRRFMDARLAAKYGL